MNDRKMLYLHERFRRSRERTAALLALGGVTANDLYPSVFAPAKPTRLLPVGDKKAAEAAYKSLLLLL